MFRSSYTLVDAVHVAFQELFGDATNPVPDWTHVTKVDPEPDKRLPTLFPAYLAATDAVSVGGSRGVTVEHTHATFEAISVAPVPAFHEPSAASHVTRETRSAATFLTLPEVLNGDSEALVGRLGAGVAGLHDDQVPGVVREALPDAVANRLLGTAAGERLVDLLTGWLVRQAVSEAYVVQNPDSAAAREAGVTADDVLTPTAARERALAAEHRLGSEIVYLEYSGTFGGEAAETTLGELADVTQWARVWYGGGVRSRAAAERVLDAGADTVVVGDVFHDVASEETRLAKTYRETVGDPSPAAIRSWVRDRVDETTAAAYLSTVPSVADPTARATTLLTATLVCRLWLAAAAGAWAPATAPPDPWTVPAFADQFADGAERYARRCRRALVVSDADSTRTPPASDADSTRMPPASDADSTRTPLASDADSTRTPLASDADDEQALAVSLPPVER